MPKPMLIRVAVPDQETADSITNHLLKEHLAASVHILGPHQTAYWWEDRICYASEFTCEIRTLEKHEKAITTVILERHPFKVPEIFAQPIHHLTPEYQAWLQEYAQGKETLS